MICYACPNSETETYFDNLLLWFKIKNSRLLVYMRSRETTNEINESYRLMCVAFVAKLNSIELIKYMYKKRTSSSLEIQSHCILLKGVIFT